MKSALNKPKTVEEYLDEVDYNWDNFTPSITALKYATFIQEANAGNEENKTPIVHMAMMDKVFNKKPKSMVLCHRGLGKTALFAEYLFLHIAAFGYMPGFGNVNLIMYVSDSINNGVKNLRRNVEHRYNNSEMLQRLVPNRRITVGTEGSDGHGLDVTSDEGYNTFLKESGGKKFTDVRMEFVNHKGHKTVIRGFGALSGIRGVKEGGSRVDLAVYDDVMSDKDAQSATVLASIEDTIYKAAQNALHPTRSKEIWLGTPFCASDSIYKAAESGVWEMAVFPVAQTFDGTTTKEDFKGSWSDRFTYEAIELKYRSAIALGRPSDFYQELMLRISSEEDRLIPEQHITQFNLDDIVKYIDGYNIYITTDAAVSERKTADFSVIMVWAVSHDGSWNLIDWWFGKVLLNVFINKLFEISKRWKKNLMGVGVEANSTQMGFISMMEEKMIREQNSFRLLSYNNQGDPGIRPAQGTSKFLRFLQVQPMFANRLIRFPDVALTDPFMSEMYNEIKNISQTNSGKRIGRAAHDDIVDTIGMISMISAVVPSKEKLDEVMKGNTVRSDAPKINLGIDIFGDDDWDNEPDDIYSSYVD